MESVNEKLPKDCPIWAIRAEPGASSGGASAEFRTLALPLDGLLREGDLQQGACRARDLKISKMPTPRAVRPRCRACARRCRYVQRSIPTDRYPDVIPTQSKAQRVYSIFC